MDQRRGGGGGARGGAAARILPTRSPLHAAAPTPAPDPGPPGLGSPRPALPLNPPAAEEFGKGTRGGGDGKGGAQGLKMEGEEVFVGCGMREERRMREIRGKRTGGGEVGYGRRQGEREMRV